MKYQLQLKAEYLAQLCAAWQSKLQLMSGGDDISDDSWGPSTADLAAIRSFEYYESTIESESDDEWDVEQETDIEDAELWEAIELNALADEFRSELHLSD
jgi:hypothetical protein